MNILKKLLQNVILVMALLYSVNTAFAEEINIPDVEYINGGIGQEDADDIRAKAGAYNLHIYLSEGTQGHSITGAAVTITNQRSKVNLDFTNCGPMLFLKLEKGTYEISAIHNGVTLIRKIFITKQRSMNIYLNWKNSTTDEEDSINRTSTFKD